MALWTPVPWLSQPLYPLEVPDAGMPDSPEWWRDRILALMAAEREDLELHQAYYEGRFRLDFATTKWQEAFGEMLAAYGDPWVKIAVDATTERLEVVGFRFGADTTGADTDAWDIWQRNALDAESTLAHQAAVTTGTGYVLVGRGADGRATLLVESPARCRVVLDPADPRRRTAGLQVVVDEFGMVTATLWREDYQAAWTMDLEAGTREWREVPGSLQGNALGVVPLIPLRNAPTMPHRLGTSDIADVIPLQDAINKLGADLLVASEFASFRQRWISGIEIPVDPETGRPMTDAFLASASRIWTVESDNARFGEFQASDLGNYWQAINALVGSFAAKTRTPPNYLLGQMVNVSADAIRAAEAGLVSKVRLRMQTFGEAWEEALRLAFQVEGDTERAQETSVEVIWRDPETRTDADRVDAATKLATLGVPNRALWLRIPGVTPTVADQWEAMAEEQAAEEPAPPVPTEVVEVVELEEPPPAE